MTALAGTAAPCAAAGASPLDRRAAQRARGSDRPAAIAIARALLARSWAAQVLKVTVERAGEHRIAGVTLSGVKLKRALDPAGFEREANAMVDLALRSAPVEEVDLWTIVPLSFGTGTVVSGDYAKPTSRTVFSVTVRRAAPADRETFWAPAWRAGLASRTPKTGTP